MDITVHIIRGCLQLPGCLVLKNSKGAKVNLGTNLVKDLDHPGPSVAIGLVQNAHYLGRAPPTFPRNLPTIVLLRNAPTIDRFSCLSSRKAYFCEVYPTCVSSSFASSLMDPLFSIFWIQQCFRPRLWVLSFDTLGKEYV